MVLQRAQEHVQLRLRYKGKVQRESPAESADRIKPPRLPTPLFLLRAEGPAEVIRLILLDCFSWKWGFVLFSFHIFADGTQKHRAAPPVAFTQLLSCHL